MSGLSPLYRTPNLETSLAQRAALQAADSELAARVTRTPDESASVGKLLDDVLAHSANGPISRDLRHALRLRYLTASDPAAVKLFEERWLPHERELLHGDGFIVPDDVARLIDSKPTGTDDRAFASRLVQLAHSGAGLTQGELEFVLAGAQKATVPSLAQAIKNAIAAALREAPDAFAPSALVDVVEAWRLVARAKALDTAAGASEANPYRDYLAGIDLSYVTPAVANQIARYTQAPVPQAPAAPSTPVLQNEILVWSGTNQFDSAGVVKQATLSQVHLENGRLIHPLFTVESPRQPVTAIGSFVPDVDGDRVLDPQFKALYVAHVFEELLNELQALGFDVGAWAQTPFKVTVDGTGPTRFEPPNSIVCSDIDGAWDSAQDKSVLVHEFGHLLINRLFPKYAFFSSGADGGLHEGFGDALAALVTQVAQPQAYGVLTGDPGRNVDNDAAVGAMNPQSHAQSGIISGFFWDVQKALLEAGRPPEDARRSALQLLVLTPAFCGVDIDITWGDIFCATRDALDYMKRYGLLDEAMAGVAQTSLEMSGAARGLLDDTYFVTQSEYRMGAENITVRFPGRSAAEVAAKLNEIRESQFPGIGTLEPGATIPLAGGGTRVEIMRLGEPYGTANLGPDGAVLGVSKDIAEWLRSGVRS